MTKTINGKKLLMIATITVMLSGVMLVTTLDNAVADPGHGNKKAKTGEHKLKCKSIGSWYNPELLDDMVFSSSDGKCSAGLGKVTSASISTVLDVTDEGCLVIKSVFDDFSMGKKGHIMFKTTGSQCFNDVDGVPLGATWDGTFCGSSAESAHTSKVIGTYAISKGIIKDVPVIGGLGDFVSEANHCDNDAPYRNSFTTKLEGTIVFPEKEI
jgi:hypothetical protein